MDLNTPLDMAKAFPPKDIVPKDSGEAVEEMTGLFDDAELLELWKELKKESIDDDWVFQRQWQRNIFYILDRQWIDYQAKAGGWRDKRMAAWIPRPVTNKCKETLGTIRAMFTSIKLSVNVRPNGADPLNVASAAIADELAPLLHEVHSMDVALAEQDFWLCSVGNAFLHTFVDYDVKHGFISVESEQCVACGEVVTSDKLAGAQPTCPGCGATEFAPAVDPLTGEPVAPKRQPKGVPATIVLSPLEISFPHSYTRFDDLPYVIRKRWRTKRYYNSDPALKAQVSEAVWQKTPQDHSLAMFTSLASMNDLGVTGNYYDGGSTSGNADEGLPEFEVWMKPCDAYPDGLVFRVAGDGDGIIIKREEEGLPGPLPYTDVKGNPLFTFTHACYEHVGGRILGSSPIDAIIQKQDQLNQLDSQVLLCLTRMGNPVWLEPKGAEIVRLTGMPGLVIKYNPLTVGGNAKPERIPGVPIDTSVMQLREQYLRDIEELAGTFDIMKGAKPAGVEAFSAIQALIERSQARFSSVFQSRGNAYKDWVRFALELERQFGPEERTKATATPARGWTFKNFQRAQIQGAFEIIVEDGSTTPKTNLGMRAAVEHANTLGMLNMADPDQQYAGLQLFGLTRMVPSLDIHVQAALQKQQAFEQWVIDPAAVQQFVMQAQAAQADYETQVAGAQQQMTDSPDAAINPIAPPPSMLTGSPLQWRPWYNAQIHIQEFLKWANDDHIRELIVSTPISEKLLEAHLAEMQMAMAPPPVAEPVGKGGGAGQAMANSGQNSAPAGNTAQPSNA